MVPQRGAGFGLGLPVVDALVAIERAVERGKQGRGNHFEVLHGDGSGVRLAHIAHLAGRLRAAGHSIA